jgi:hypothetical protein
LDTDHSFSDSRIALEAEVLRWLGRSIRPRPSRHAAFTPLKAAYDEANPSPGSCAASNRPKVYEDDQVLAFMDRAPAEPATCW